MKTKGPPPLQPPRHPTEMCRKELAAEAGKHCLRLPKGVRLPQAKEWLLARLHEMEKAADGEPAAKKPRFEEAALVGESSRAGGDEEADEEETDKEEEEADDENDKDTDQELDELQKAKDRPTPLKKPKAKSTASPLKKQTTYTRAARRLLRMASRTKRNCVVDPTFTPPKTPKGLKASERKVKVHQSYDTITCFCDVERQDMRYTLLQIIEVSYPSRPATYHFWTRSGRMGRVDHKVAKAADSAEELVAAFEEKFTQLTGHQWEAPNKFDLIPGKYVAVHEAEEVEPPAEDPELAPSPTPTESTEPTPPAEPPSLLPPHVQDLVRAVFEAKEQPARPFIPVPIDAQPMGRMSRRAIAKAFVILDQLRSIFKDRNMGRNPLTPEEHTEIRELSNEFYSVIPQQYGRIYAINSLDAIEDKAEFLAEAADIELIRAEKLQAKASEQSEVDHNYAWLGCELELVGKDSALGRLLTRAFVNSANLKERPDRWSEESVKRIWIVRNKGQEESRTNDALGSYQLLWHGTKAWVVAAILKEGIRKMQPTYPVFMSNLAAKSLGYCAQDERQTSFMFLSRVTCDRVKSMSFAEPWRQYDYAEGAKADFDIAWARGGRIPDPKEDLSVALPDGSWALLSGGEMVDDVDFYPPANERNNNVNPCSELLIHDDAKIKLSFLFEYASN